MKYSIKYVICEILKVFKVVKVVKTLSRANIKELHCNQQDYNYILRDDRSMHPSFHLLCHRNNGGKQGFLL